MADPPPSLDQVKSLFYDTFLVDGLGDMKAWVDAGRPGGVDGKKLHVRCHIPEPDVLLPRFNEIVARFENAPCERVGMQQLFMSGAQAQFNLIRDEIKTWKYSGEIWVGIGRVGVTGV